MSRYRRFCQAGFSLLEILLALVLLAILSITVHEHLATSIRVSALTQAQLNCVVAANNILEMGLASETPLLKGLRYLLSDDGNMAPLGVEKVLPAYMQPSGKIGNCFCTLEKRTDGATATITFDPDGVGGVAPTTAEIATDVVIITIRDESAGNRFSLHAYRANLE